MINDYNTGIKTVSVTIVTFILHAYKKVQMYLSQLTNGLLVTTFIHLQFLSGLSYLKSASCKIQLQMVNLGMTGLQSNSSSVSLI